MPTVRKAQSSGSKTPRLDVVRCPGSYGASGYRSANSSRTDGITFSGASGDAHMRHDRIKMIYQSRAFYRDNAIYKGLIDRATGYIVGHGFGLQMASKNKTYNAKVERLWRDWWRRPEVRNLLSGKRTGRMTCREVILTGDTASIKTDLGLVQLIEAEQITDGRGGDGIEKNSYGRPTKFTVIGYGKGGKIDRRRKRTINPEDLLFLTNPDRPSATRGVPACEASFPMIHRINDVCDSEAIAYQLLSRLAASITREDAPSLAYGESREDEGAADTDGDLATRMTDIGYALLFHAKPGEEIKGIERNIPGKNFTESIRMFLRLLGLPLGMPLELVLLDWTQSNYSQTRAVLWQAYYQNFQDWQDLMDDFWFRGLLEWKIGHWIQEGQITERIDGLEHEWIKPTFPWIDQYKEAQAYALRMDRTFGTHAMVCKSLNMDPEMVLNTREQEIRDAISRCQKIEDQTGEKVPWQIFAGLEVPKAKDTKPNDDDPKDDEDKDK